MPAIAVDLGVVTGVLAIVASLGSAAIILWRVSGFSTKVEVGLERLDERLDKLEKKSDEHDSLATQFAVFKSEFDGMKSKVQSLETWRHAGEDRPSRGA